MVPTARSSGREVGVEPLGRRDDAHVRDPDEAEEGAQVRRVEVGRPADQRVARAGDDPRPRDVVQALRTGGGEPERPPAAHHLIDPRLHRRRDPEVVDRRHEHQLVGGEQLVDELVARLEAGGVAPGEHGRDPRHVDERDAQRDVAPDEHVVRADEARDEVVGEGAAHRAPVVDPGVDPQHHPTAHARHPVHRPGRRPDRECPTLRPPSLCHGKLAQGERRRSLR